MIPKKIFEPYSGDADMLIDVDADVETEAVLSRLSRLPEPDIKLSAATVHWGYFSKELVPILNVTSGQEVS